MTLLRLTERWYRNAARLCPETFRKEFREEMVFAYRALAVHVLEESGRSALLLLFGRSLFDVARTAIEEHRVRSSFARSTPWLDRLSQDLRTAGRSLASRPGFSAVTVLTLGLWAPRARSSMPSIAS